MTEILSKIGFDWHLALSHTVNFLIIFILLVKFALPKLKKTIDERKAKIEEGLATFAKSAQILKESEAEKANILKSAEIEKKGILAESESIKKNILAKGEADAREIISASKTEGEKIKADSYEKGASELESKIGDILQMISQKAFAGKVSAEVNNEFVKNIFKESYGK